MNLLKSISLITLFLFVFVSILSAGSTTTNLGLYKPDEGETGWASNVNSNFDILDSAVGGSGVAPANATYVVQTANSTLTNEQALSALSTGLLKNTTTTGVLSIAAAGTDYENPLTFNSPLSRSTNTISLTQSGIDHGSISGLTDDDHTQYVLHSIGTTNYSIPRWNSATSKFIDFPVPSGTLFTYALQYNDSNDTMAWTVYSAPTTPSLSAVLAVGNTSGANNIVMATNQTVNFGTTSQSSVTYDGTNLIVNPKVSGTGQLRVLGDVVASGDIGRDGDPNTYFRFGADALTTTLGGQDLFVANEAATDTVTFGASWTMQFGDTNAATKLGFFGITPVVRNSAFTQTYSTATKTHSNPTATTVTDTNGIAGFLAAADRTAVVTAVNNLITDVANVKGVLNALIDDLQLYGLEQ